MKKIFILILAVILLTGCTLSTSYLSFPREDVSGIKIYSQEHDSSIEVTDKETIDYIYTDIGSIKFRDQYSDITSIVLFSVCFLDKDGEELKKIEIISNDAISGSKGLKIAQNKNIDIEYLENLFD